MESNKNREAVSFQATKTGDFPKPYDSCSRMLFIKNILCIFGILLVAEKIHYFCCMSFF